MSQAQWWYAINGQRMGPASLADLNNLIQTGTVNAETLVWSEGMAAWQAAHTVEVLAMIFNMPPPIPVPPPLSNSRRASNSTNDDLSERQKKNEESITKRKIRKPAEHTDEIHSRSNFLNAGAKKGIGVVLLVVGLFLMYHAFQQTDTFAYRVNNFVGNTNATRGVGIDLIVGFIFSLAGGAMITMGRKKH